jgi:hypothetical protein
LKPRIAGKSPGWSAMQPQITLTHEVWSPSLHDWQGAEKSGTFYLLRSRARRLLLVEGRPGRVGVPLGEQLRAAAGTVRRAPRDGARSGIGRVEEIIRVADAHVGAAHRLLLFDC